MLISQGFNSETGDLATFVENCKRADTTDNTDVTNFSASDKDSDTKRHTKRSKFKEREENGKKRHNKNSSLYCSLHGENKNHTSRECKLIKARAKDKENPKYGKMITRRISKNLNFWREKLTTIGPSI